MAHAKKEEIDQVERALAALTTTEKRPELIDRAFIFVTKRSLVPSLSSVFLAHASNETRAVGGSDELFTASLDLGFG